MTTCGSRPPPAAFPRGCFTRSAPPRIGTYHSHTQLNDLGVGIPTKPCPVGGLEAFSGLLFQLRYRFPSL